MELLGVLGLTVQIAVVGTAINLPIALGVSWLIVKRRIPPQTSARNAVRARVSEIHMVGSMVLVYADIGTRMMVEITPSSLDALELSEGTEIYLIMKANSVISLEASGG